MTCTPQPVPRVTLGIATYNRDTYLAEAVASCLAQDYDSLEVLVVLDGTTNPAVEEVLARFDDPRLRVVRHAENRGISAAYDTLVSAGRGELIAMLGDDDVCLPRRIRRQVEIFDRYPDTGVVHGDALIIDGEGQTVGSWTSTDMSRSALLHCFVRRHDYIVDPTRMVHRRVYEQVGGYDPRFKVAQDFEFWLRVGKTFRFRHCPGAPLIKLRRHGENGSDESQREAEVAEVELALEEALERYSLRTLVPEVDWAVLHPADAERAALLALADQLAHRELPVPGLASRVQARARAIARPKSRPRNGRRLLMTMFGYNDSGGGTILPRLISKELVRRGWDVTVFAAAVAPLPQAGPYAVSESEQDGVRLVMVHNRSHGLFDLGNPLRELDDPLIRQAFEHELERSSPDVVHFHNLHNLGASLLDVAASHGIPSYFTTHQYWSLCPRGYLLDGDGRMCAGPGDGARCAQCVLSSDVSGHRRRLAEIRAGIERGTRAVLAISESVRATLLAAGYPPELVDVVRQSMPHSQEIWNEVGARRARGRGSDALTVAFLGNALAQKGPHLLVEAAQRVRNPVRVRIHGEVPPSVAAALTRIDRRGVVELCGGYSPSEIGVLLQGSDVAALPSIWWDCANLAAEECHAAGLPLLVPRLGGLAETVRDGIDGLHFDGLSAADLAQKVDRISDEPGLLERLQAGIEPPRSFAAHVDELEAYYDGERPGRHAGATPLAIRWQGDHGQPTSLSIINDHVAARLDGPVQRVGINGTSADPPLPHAAAVEVRHQWPPDLSPARSGSLALIQPWEFGAIPSEWVGPLRANVDELWVPSEYVRGMYLAAGLEPERVVVIPNGVDLDRFSPADANPAQDRPTRFVFVGGLVGRKGPDLLFDAFTTAFADRDDVTLVVKDFGADGIYREGDRARFQEHAAAGRLPRIELIDATLSENEIVELYRSCDVLVAPYRGEGFCMPALEAMACGLPVITTAGGPTDEFVPAAAGWRIASQRREFPGERVSTLATHGRPWMLEPSLEDLVRCLREADEAGREGRCARGAVGRAAAHALSWDSVAARYQERIATLAGTSAARPVTPHPLEGEYAVRLLATPAWRGEDRLADLLGDWSRLTDRSTSACLYLLADPAVDGSPDELEAHVVMAAASAGADLESCADIDIVMEPARPGRDEAVHAAADVYLPLHPACAGHKRIARRAGSAVASPCELARVIAAAQSPIGAVS